MTTTLKNQQLNDTPFDTISNDDNPQKSAELGPQMTPKKRGAFLSLLFFYHCCCCMSVFCLKKKKGGGGGLIILLQKGFAAETGGRAGAGLLSLDYPDTLRSRLNTS